MARTTPENKSVAPVENKALGVPTNDEPEAAEPTIVTATAGVKVRISHYVDGYRPGDTPTIPAERAAELIHGKYATAL